MQAMLDDDDPVVAALARARLEKKGGGPKTGPPGYASPAITVATKGNRCRPIWCTSVGTLGDLLGGGGFNVQNLGRSGLGGQVRGLLIPKPGYTFIIADLAQIEARITAWYGGEQGMLQGFRRVPRLVFRVREPRPSVRSPQARTTNDPPATRDRLGGVCVKSASRPCSVSASGWVRSSLWRHCGPTPTLVPLFDNHGPLSSDLRRHRAVVSGRLPRHSEILEGT